MNLRELFSEVGGVFLAGAGLFLLASLFSFEAADLPALVAPAREAPANWGGSLGAWLAGSLLRWVGTLGTLGTALLLLGFAAGCLRRAAAAAPPDASAPEASAAPPTPVGQVDPLRRLGGALLVILTLSVLERVLAASPLGALLVRDWPPGGYWGLFLEAVLLGQLGAGGTPIAVAGVLLVGLVLSTDRPLRDWAGRSVAQACAAAEAARTGVSQASEALARVAPEPLPEPEPAPVLEAVDPLAEEPAPAAPAAAAPAPPESPVEEASPGHADEWDELEEDEEAEEEEGSAGEAAPPEAPLPRVELLQGGEAAQARPPVRDERGKRIEETLAQFKVAAQVVSVECGPAVTLFALELGRGVKVQRVAGLLDNLALALRVPGIRLQAPIPGTGWVGLEVPNEEPETVRFRELLEHPGWRKKDPALPVFLGKDSGGRPLIADLARMPHLLIAGATGSGKSVCLNTIILSLLMTRTPREVQLILIDPKQVEMAQFKKVPHLMAPVVTDMRQAGAVLGWMVNKMEERYGLLAQAGVRHIKEYNELGKDELARRLGTAPAELEKKRIPWQLSYVVLVVDELNDLMMVSQKEVEASITRLAQKSRAVGIHVVLATQRPSVDVITGVIKSNLPARIAFRVASKVDSRTILDTGGADKLLGQGDMLFLPPGRGQPIRALGALITDAEVKAVVKSLTKAAEPRYSQELLDLARTRGPQGPGSPVGAGEPEVDPHSDPVYLDAVRVILEAGKGSVSLLQRKLELGYARAARYLDAMAEEGLVGPAKGSKPREVKTSLDAWEASRKQAA